ncbi:MAG: hypothetical protein NXI31_04650 [bacterium]|nr:hypothetical protein [bacterium]
MLIKGLCLGAVLVSTPLCLFAPEVSLLPQGKERDPDANRPTVRVQDPRAGETLSPRQRRQLDKMKRELDGAKRDVEELRRQLEEVLDTLDGTFAQQRHRSCAPSRSNRALMSHFQWLEKNSHEKRAEKALATLVGQHGDNADRLNSAAWSLMTDKGTAGKFDRVALALADKMEKSKRRLRHHHLDTIALARFLNGNVDSAVKLQQKAIAAGGNSDDYRRRLRTYEAAKNAVLLAKQTPAKPSQPVPHKATPVKARAGTIVATATQEEEEE